MTAPTSLANGGVSCAGQAPEPSKQAALAQFQEGDDNGMAVWDETSRAIRTSIDETTDEGRRLCSRVLMGADMKIRNAAGQTHPIIAFFAHGVMLKTPIAGEIVPKIRLVMIRQDGKTISTLSEPCIKAFAYLARCKGAGPWREPLWIEVREFPTGEGKSYCSLCEVAPPGESAGADAPAKKGKA